MVGRELAAERLPILWAPPCRAPPRRSRRPYDAGVEIDAAADGVDARDAHVEGVAEAQRGAGALAVQDRALLVQLPPLAPAVGLAAAGRASRPRRPSSREPPAGAGGAALAPAAAGRRRAQQPDGEHALESAGAPCLALPRARLPKAMNAPAEISPVISPANTLVVVAARAAAARGRSSARRRRRRAR